MVFISDLLSVFFLWLDYTLELIQHLQDPRQIRPHSITRARSSAVIPSPRPKWLPHVSVFCHTQEGFLQLESKGEMLCL